MQGEHVTIPFADQSSAGREEPKTTAKACIAISTLRQGSSCLGQSPKRDNGHARAAAKHCLSDSNFQGTPPDSLAEHRKVAKFLHKQSQTVTFLLEVFQGTGLPLFPLGQGDV